MTQRHRRSFKSRDTAASSTRAAVCSALLMGLVPQFASAQFTIRVSNEYRAIHYVKRAEIAQGAFIVFEMPALGWGDTYTAKARIDGATARLVVIDQRDVKSNNPNPKPLLSIPIAETEIDLGKPPSDLGSSGIIFNTGTKPLRIDIRVDRIGTRPAEAREGIRKMMSPPLDALNRAYRVPPIAVTVQPCGEINAYSAPNITVCTELLAHLFEAGKNRAIIPILLHEMGHSLLQIWNLPGWDNEDLVDEFAAVFLAEHSPEILNEFISWLERQNSVDEAVTQLAVGSRHTISLQRARNMRRILDNPQSVVNRWGKLLAPYAKRAP